MKNLPTTNDEQPADSVDITDPDALLFCIEPRRYVVVRQDTAQRLKAPTGGWEELCRLQPGDRVIYEGTPTVVKAVEVY